MKSLKESQQPAGYGNVGKIPAAKSSDGGGERGGRIKNGVAMGKQDATGTEKLFNTGKTDGTCYTHGRKSRQ